LIVSHAHRFIFLKTKKTASSSIEFALGAFCGDSDIITPASENEEALRVGHRAQNYWLPWSKRSVIGMLRAPFSKAPERHVGFYNHMPAARVRRLVGENVWASYFKFAFERNPWDRQVSLYYWRYPDRATRPPFEIFLKDPRWLKTTRNFGIYSIDGRIAVDLVGRYDRLGEDLQAVLAKVGIAGEARLPRLKSHTREDRSSYRSYYTEETRAIVGELYAQEIQAFGFKF
jgi:hypothetical protein